MYPNINVLLDWLKKHTETDGPITLSRADAVLLVSRIKELESEVYALESDVAGLEDELADRE